MEENIFEYLLFVVILLDVLFIFLVRVNNWIEILKRYLFEFKKFLCWIVGLGIL